MLRVKSIKSFSKSCLPQNAHTTAKTHTHIRLQNTRICMHMTYTQTYVYKHIHEHTHTHIHHNIHHNMHAYTHTHTYIHTSQHTYISSQHTHKKHTQKVLEPQRALTIFIVNTAQDANDGGYYARRVWKEGKEPQINGVCNHCQNLHPHRPEFSHPTLPPS